MLLPLLLAVSVSAQPVPLAAGAAEALKAGSNVLFDHASPALPAFRKQDAVELLTLSQLADRLSQDPEAMRQLAQKLRGAAGSYGRGWPGLDGLDDAARGRLADAFQRADKSTLDRFPTMTLDELKALVGEFGRRQGPAPAEPPYPAEEDLALPGAPAKPADDAFLKDWGAGLYHGDRTLSPRATAYGDDVRFSEVLNRLSLNGAGSPSYTLRAWGRRYASVAALMDALLASGHTVTAKDMRFFANFGGLWYQRNGQWISVVTPFFVDTGAVLPSGRRVIVPVTHAHLELDVEGPLVNARVIYYLGVGGSPQFYPLATEDKPWVGGRLVARWFGAEAARLAARAAVTRRDLAEKARRFNLPLGGYGPLGACTDVEAMITGTPIYPQIRDIRYYADGSQIDAWAAALPRDSDAVPPSLSRVWDSRPFETLQDLKVEQSRPVYEELKP